MQVTGMMIVIPLLPITNQNMKLPLLLKKIHIIDGLIIEPKITLYQMVKKKSAQQLNIKIITQT